MANITYNRAFTHVDWIDNEDVVQAGGEKGFNVEFHAIEAEFDKISAVVAQISAGLVIVPPTLTFAPSLFPNLTNPEWVKNNGIATKATNQTGADGWMQLQLPDGTVMQTMTVIGAKSGNAGSFQILLTQQPLTGGALTTLLAIPLGGQPDGSFQVTGQVAGNVKVDSNANKYMVIARIVGADAAASASINAIQIVCKPS
jgi:hypothetical protein